MSLPCLLWYYRGAVGKTLNDEMTCPPIANSMLRAGFLIESEGSVDEPKVGKDNWVVEAIRFTKHGYVYGVWLDKN